MQHWSKGAKCDEWGTRQWARSILRFHDQGDSAARWLRVIDLRYPIKGSNRTKAPPFADAQGAPPSATGRSPRSSWRHLKQQ